MMATPKNSDESRIRELIEDRVRLLKAKDLEGLVTQYAPDVVSFDAIDAMQTSGRNRVGARAKDWFSSYDGPIEYTIHDLSVVAGSAVAFCRCLNRVVGTLKDGTSVNMWVRTTVCLQKLNDDWFISHEHTSVPFDAGTGSALLDLHP